MWQHFPLNGCLQVFQISLKDPLAVINRGYAIWPRRCCAMVLVKEVSSCPEIESVQAVNR